MLPQLLSAEEFARLSSNSANSHTLGRVSELLETTFLGLGTCYSACDLLLLFRAFQHSSHVGSSRHSSNRIEVMVRPFSNTDATSNDWNKRWQYQIYKPKQQVMKFQSPSNYKHFFKLLRAIFRTLIGSPTLESLRRLGLVRDMDLERSAALILSGNRSAP